MGYTSYSVDNRSIRSSTLNYVGGSTDSIFTQQKKAEIHTSMSPYNLIYRECLDSKEHPNTIPIILSLDVTGSMGMIPRDLIATGLPKMMGSMIQKGLSDVSLCFIAVGDHECDTYPLQVGQFESGDAELDMWLTRTYLEGGGGGNSGESYHLAWFLAANHMKIDSFDKRNKKGFLFTVGDEPCLKNLPSSALKTIFNGNYQKTNFDLHELLAEAQREWNVYHLHVLHSNQSEKALSSWKELLNDNCIEIKDYHNIPDVLSQIVIDNNKNIIENNNVDSKESSDNNIRSEIML